MERMYEASAPSFSSQSSSSYVLSPTHSNESVTTSPTTVVVIEDYTSSRQQQSEHVQATVDVMWEARRAREEADRIADDKLMEAVCKASLAEFTATKSAHEQYESEVAANTQTRELELERLRQRREAAEAKKHEAMQKVIAAKQLAAEMSERAKQATKAFEEQTARRVDLELQREQSAQENEQAKALRLVQQHREEAIQRRVAAEQKAKEAMERAASMREKAIDAVQLVRQHSRLQVEHELTQEEVVRERERAKQLSNLDADKRLATERKQAAERKAQQALARAKELQAKAEQARVALGKPTSAS